MTLEDEPDISGVASLSISLPFTLLFFFSKGSQSRYV